MDKKYYIGMKIEKPIIEFYGTKIDAIMPDGCVGIMFVFSNKKKAEKFHGKKMPLSTFRKLEEVK